MECWNPTILHRTVCSVQLFAGLSSLYVVTFLTPTPVLYNKSDFSVQKLIPLIDAMEYQCEFALPDIIFRGLFLDKSAQVCGSRQLFAPYSFECQSGSVRPPFHVIKCRVSRKKTNPDERDELHSITVNTAHWGMAAVKSRYMLDNLINENWYVLSKQHA